MNPEGKDFAVLKKTIIDTGLCTTCGTCVGVCHRGCLGIRWIDGDAEPYQTQDNCSGCGLCLEVCPGKEIPLLDLEEAFLGRRRDIEKEPAGVFLKAFRAQAVSEKIKAAGASGGTATALLTFALESDLVQASLVAGFDESRPCLTLGKLVRNSGELIRHARSKYGGNPPLNTGLAEAAGAGLERMAVIGCPCHVHGVRKLMRLGQPKKLAQSIRLVLGLFCASQFHFEGTRHLLAEYCGIRDLEEIEMIDYRWADWPGRFYVRTKDGREFLVDRHEYMYHHLVFGWQRDRCSVCLDHAAEVADLAFGDYWSPGLKPGDPGQGLVIARSRLGLDVLGRAQEEGYLSLSPVDLNRIALSGSQLKKKRNPFTLKRRAEYNWPVPDFGFLPGHQPGPKRIMHRAPSFDGPLVEERKK